MRLEPTQKACILAVVNRFHGSAYSVVDGLKQLSDWELLGNNPGPESKYLSTEDLEALAKIYKNVVGSFLKRHKNKVLVLLEDIIGQKLNIEQVNDILEQFKYV